MKTKVVEAVAAAATYKQNVNKVEEAMSAAVTAAYAEADEIWHGDLDEEEKRKQVAAILDPVEVKRRMLAARDEVRRSR